MQTKESHVPEPVRKWLSAIGKKGSKKGRSTPPRNADGSPGHWSTSVAEATTEATPPVTPKTQVH